MITTNSWCLSLAVTYTQIIAIDFITVYGYDSRVFLSYPLSSKAHSTHRVRFLLHSLPENAPLSNATPPLFLIL